MGRFGTKCRTFDLYTPFLPGGEGCTGLYGGIWPGWNGCTVLKCDILSAGKGYAGRYGGIR
jgi:hypothetical protein